MLAGDEIPWTLESGDKGSGGNSVGSMSRDPVRESTRGEK